MVVNWGGAKEKYGKRLTLVDSCEDVFFFFFFFFFFIYSTIFKNI